MNIYVGNLAYSVTEESLRNLFSQKGTVTAVKIMMDRDTGKMRGFAFVDMSDATEAQKAISELNGFEFEGRALRVNEARAPEPRPRSSTGQRFDRPFRSNGQGGGSRGGFGDNRRRGF